MIWYSFCKKDLKPLGSHRYQDFIPLSFPKLGPPIYNSLLIEKLCLHKYQQGNFESLQIFPKNLTTNTQFFIDVSKE